MTKLLVILLEQLRSLYYESIIKIKIPENLAEKPPPPRPPYFPQGLLPVTKDYLSANAPHLVVNFPDKNKHKWVDKCCSAS